jgi:hypothetical protein
MSTWRRPFVFPRRFQGFGGHELPISLQSAARDRHATGRWVRGSRDFASAGGAEVFEDGHLERWDGKKLLEGDVLIYHKFSIIYIYNYMVICVHDICWFKEIPAWNHDIYIYIYT